MVNQIIDGISMKLNQVFGDGYKIYSDHIDQALEKPCFFIAVLKPSEKQVIGPRFFKEYPFQVRYYSQNAGSLNEMMTISEKLCSELRLITLPDESMLRGTKIRYEVLEGILYFFVNYDLYVVKTKDANKMENLAVEQTIGKGD